MIVEERMRTYINSLDMGNTPFSGRTGEGSTCRRSSHYPQGNAEHFLKMFLAATRPEKILEVGTAVGFFHFTDV